MFREIPLSLVVLYRYHPLAMENTLTHFLLLLLYFFYFFILFSFFIIINSCVRNKNYFLYRASRIRNLATHFFMHLIACLHTQSCTSHFLHLKQSFMHMCTLNILEQKVNLRSISLTIKPEPFLGIQCFLYMRRSFQERHPIP